MILIISMPSDGVIALENDLSLPTHKYTVNVIFLGPMRILALLSPNLYIFLVFVLV